MNKNGKIVKLRTASKKQFLSQMKDEASQLEVFMKKNKLGVQQRLDMIKIFDFYNTL
jgi:lysyl-tRNA synthetase class II